MSEEVNTQLSEENKKREVTMLYFNQLYSNLIEMLRNLPMHDVLKGHCFMNFDQGAYWARQGISLMAIPTDPAPAVEALVEPENVEATSEQSTEAA